jgi:hypothetical protein
VFGSTGAVGSFTVDEKRLVIRTAVEQAAGRVPIVAGTGAITTQEAVRITQYAEEVGAAGALVVPITYWPLTPDEVARRRGPRNPERASGEAGRLIPPASGPAASAPAAAAAGARA